MKNCETCHYYIYEEEQDGYFCSMDLDEDEMEKLLTGHFSQCPYYRSDDDYLIVRKQN